MRRPKLINCYFIRWFMKYQHIDPEEAVRIHIDVQAKKSVAIHWGTFALAYEVSLFMPRAWPVCLTSGRIWPSPSSLLAGFWARLESALGSHVWSRDKTVLGCGEESLLACWFLGLFLLLMKHVFMSSKIFTCNPGSRKVGYHALKWHLRNYNICTL